MHWLAPWMEETLLNLTRPSESSRASRRLSAPVLALLTAAILLSACTGRAAPTAAVSSTSGGAAGSSTSVKVGVLHSLSGTMSISETSVKDAELLAIEEINAKGGVLGKQITPVIEDGA